jgi:iron only hydrogenase large subunit-like protein
MNKSPENTAFHHALKVLDHVCIGCTHCMKACPTEAIRIIRGKARIIANRCIDCGECYKACPVNAIIVEQDDFASIWNYKTRVALVPAVLIGQFADTISTSRIFRALYELGFTHVFEVESTVDLVQKGLEEFRKTTRTRPLISAYCPAVVRLIQVRFPGLVDHIARVNPPIDMSAMYFRQKLRSEGHADKDTGIFYVTPCAAKIAAVKSPVGEVTSPVDGVINMKYLYNLIMQQITRNPEAVEMTFHQGRMSADGIQWSLTGGEAVHLKERSLAVDGINHVSEILEKVENGEMQGLSLLELRACDESCAGGVLVSGNRFLTVQRLQRRAKDYPPVGDLSPVVAYEGLKLFFDKVEPRPIEKLDENIREALRKMDRKRRLMCYLPAFDCAACGAPSCQALAGDVVQGKANVSHCVFIQQTMLRSGMLTPDHALKITADVWGDDRLTRDCKKIGAKDENSPS